MTTVGPYELVRPLGTGGMGEVFLGRDSRLHRQVALKRVVAAADARAQVLREARAAARLTHPNIAAVYDVLDAADGAFIVMEYVDGESLAARIARGPLPADEAVAIGRQLASAVDAAHRQGIVHRDLKPSNVQLTPAGTAKVLDFGVAKFLPLNSTTTTIEGGTIGATLPGNPGTPAYMAPEQLAGRSADARSDVYSLGAVLYEMTTGVRPYCGRDAVPLIEEIATGEPRPAHTVNPRVPRRLSQVISHALARDPARRLQSARDLEQALAQCVSRQPTGRRLTDARTMIAAVSVLAIAAIAVVSRLVPNRADVSRRPIVLAVLPVDNPTADANAEYLGAGIAAVVASNFSSIPGVTTISRASTAPFGTRRNDLDGMQRELGATAVLDVTLTGVTPRAQAVARLRNPGAGGTVWQQTITGDALSVEKTLLDGVAKALAGAPWHRRLSAAETARIEKLPTGSADALLAYSEARALLDPSNAPDAAARAVQLLQAAIARDPKFSLAYAALGDAYWAAYARDKDPGLVEKATAAVDTALRLDPDQAPVYAALATMYQQTGRYEDATKAIRRALDLQPDSDEFHRLFATVLAARGDYEAAAAEARRAIQIRGNWSNYFSLGRIEFAAAHLEAALEAFRRTTELNPGFAGGFQMLGATYHMQGDLQNAIGNYEHSVRLAPNAPAYSNLALAYYQAKRYAESIAAYNEAIRQSPNDLKMYRNIADVYRAAGDPAAARRNYEKTLTLARRELTVNPRNAITIVTAAICEANLGQRAEAERHASEAAAIAAHDTEVRYRVAKVYLALGERSAALAALRAAVAAGYSPDAVRRDEELAGLRGSDLDRALAEGLAGRTAATGGRR